MSTDRELLELAALAAGIEDFRIDDGGYLWADKLPGGDSGAWSPLHDDGDALRLVVQLGIAVTPYPIYNRPKIAVVVKDYHHDHIVRPVGVASIEVIETYAARPEAATRRAITRAAAEIARKQGDTPA